MESHGLLGYVEGFWAISLPTFLGLLVHLLLGSRYVYYIIRVPMVKVYAGCRQSVEIARSLQARVLLSQIPRSLLCEL